MKPKKKIRKPYLKSIIVGFTALYLFSMVISTSFMKYQFAREDENALSDIITKISLQLVYLDSVVEYEEGERFEKLMLNQLDNILSIEGTSEYHQFSAALYDDNGNKLGQSANQIHFSDSFWDKKAEDENRPAVLDSEVRASIGYYFDLSEYFSENEISELLNYQKEIIDDEKSGYQSYRYQTYACIHEETGELAWLVIYNRSTQLAEWWWENPKKEKGAPLLESYALDWMQLNFLYLDLGENYAEKWMEDEYLQGFPEQYDHSKYDTFFTKNKVQSATLFQNEHTSQRTIISLHGENGEEMGCCLEVRRSSNPWLAAIDYMKHIYIIGFLLTAVCVLKVICSTNKTYEQRSLLEETRRDFTNAIAHELKTPLGIIRGFAENLNENTIEEKKEYYIKQIVGQTEEMDKLVKEMIYISKLDSEELVLKKERISMKELIEEQIEKLKMAAESKNLEIRYHIEKDFIFEGDRYYLEKAVWNLISNAVEYNRQDGFINILINSDECCIENSGTCIAEEDLPYIFDMFYSGDKSRNSKEKHMGLGLYLAKKIFGMNRLKITAENMENGVRVKIYK